MGALLFLYRYGFSHTVQRGAFKQDIFKFFGITPKNLFECFVDSDCEFLIDRMIELCDLAIQKNRPIMFQ